MRLLGDEVAKAFARFPYPESFFNWREQENGTGTLSVLNRADRPPGWYAGGVESTEFPATVLTNPPELHDLLRLLRNQASLRTRFIVFETTINGKPYQVVARPIYVPPTRTKLHSIIGFTVNIDWVKTHYFNDLVSEFVRVIEGRHSVANSTFGGESRQPSESVASYVAVSRSSDSPPCPGGKLRSCAVSRSALFEPFTASVRFERRSSAMNRCWLRRTGRGEHSC